MKINKRQKEFKRYRLLQQIKFQDRKEGFVKIYPNNTHKHELVKFLVADKLKRQGYSIYSECRFNDNSGRADLIAIAPDSTGYAIEIVLSESEKRFNEKLDKYPLEFNLVKVDCESFDINKWEL